MSEFDAAVLAAEESVAKALRRVYKCTLTRLQWVRAVQEMADAGAAMSQRRSVALRLARAGGDLSRARTELRMAEAGLKIAQRRRLRSRRSPPPVASGELDN